MTVILLSGALLLQTSAAPMPEVKISVTSVRYECVDRDLAQAKVQLKVTLANRGGETIAFPREWVLLGSQRYARTVEGLETEQATKLDGILHLLANESRTTTIDDFVRVPPGQSHQLVSEEVVLVSRTGERVAGVLNVAEYYAQFQVRPGPAIGLQSDAWERLKRELGPVWHSAVWSQPFRLVLPAVPERLPGCVPVG